VRASRVDLPCETCGRKLVIKLDDDWEQVIGCRGCRTWRLLTEFLAEALLTRRPG
jgi:hypothetical protein